jgi:hypothetical protein
MRVEMKNHKVKREPVAVRTTDIEINALATFNNHGVVNNSWGTSSDFLFNVLPQESPGVGIENAANDAVFEFRRMG